MEAKVVTIPERYGYVLGEPVRVDPCVTELVATRWRMPVETWSWDGRYHSSSWEFPKFVQPEAGVLNHG